MKPLTPNNLPKYVKNMLPRLSESRNYDLPNYIPGYTWELTGKWKLGYSSQLLSEAEMLIAYSNRMCGFAKDEDGNCAIIHQSLPGDSDKSTVAKSRRNGERNKVTLVIYDPVARCIEKAKEELKKAAQR